MGVKDRLLRRGPFQGRLPLFDFKFLVLNFLFDLFCIQTLHLEVNADVRVHRHVLVGDPHEGKPGDEISPPVEKKKFVAGEDEKEQRHVVAETVLAREQVEELALPERLAFATTTDAVLARLTKDLLVSDGPGDAGYGNREHEQPDNLGSERHGGWMRNASL